MNRSEFLEKLRNALENDLSGPQIQENIAYYDEYIRNEIKNGKTEQEVLDMLGDPWVIARTIIDTRENTGESYQNNFGTYDADKQHYEEEKIQKHMNDHSFLHMIGIDAWWKKVLVVLGILLVIFIIVSVISGLITLIAPVLIPLLVVLLVFKILGKR